MFNNLLIRSLSGLIFAAVMAAGMLFHPVSYLVLILLVTGVMTWEYFRITIKNRFILAQAMTITTNGLLFLLFWLLMRYQIQGIWFLLLAFPISAIWVSLLYQKRSKSYAKSPYLFVPVFSIALPFALTNLLAFDPTGNYFGKTLLSLFLLLWASDVGAYLFGMSLGQKNGHKLFPSLSPKKSWEGYIGGLFTVVFVGYLLNRLHWLPYPLVHCLIVSLLLHLFGVWGDLSESQLKRHFNVKDSGKMMPGHGGLLDRFDSATLSFPVVIAYLKLFPLLKP